MKRVIDASLYKMFHDKGFRFCLIGTVLWALLVGGMLSWIADGKINLADPFAMAKYWRDFIAYHSINVPLLTSMIVLFSAEYKDKSWKLWIAKGISKTKYYFAKLICCLGLEIMISCLVVLTGLIFGVLVLSMPMSAALMGSFLTFFIGQCIAHATITILAFTVIFLIRNGEIASSVNVLLLVFGSMALSKIEGAMGLGDLLTGVWAFSQFEYATFGFDTDWIRLVIVFLAYVAACFLTVITFAARWDAD